LITGKVRRPAMKAPAKSVPPLIGFCQMRSPSGFGYRSQTQS
jgi:hypothetical protein